MEKQLGLPIWKRSVDDIIGDISSVLDGLSVDESVAALNRIRMALHEKSPFSSEPVDCVIWVKNEEVHANDYNPNSVAPPEMKLLELSIKEDGYTQPIVGFDNGGNIEDVVFGDNEIEVVDGFHRHRVGKECKEITERVHGYLPIIAINQDRKDLNDRMASTIRHNRARGKHSVDAMSDIVMELKKRNWKDEKIAKELGMEPDEVLRLSQIAGLAEMFASQEFSMAWEMESEDE